jgi:hypothetical protein
MNRIIKATLATLAIFAAIAAILALLFLIVEYLPREYGLIIFGAGLFGYAWYYVYKSLK